VIDASEYEALDGLALAALVRAGEVGPAEVVETAIALIGERNPVLNAVVHEMSAQAREQAAKLAGRPDEDGGPPLLDLPAPFGGVPFLVKDAGAAVAGEPLTGSCRLFEGFVPRRDSELVRRFKAAGLIILGKTNTPELAAAAVTESKMRGPCRNPWDLSRTPGGSSGGSAAAVAARMVPLAHGADGGGSLRIPGSCCGLFALKPSWGRNPQGPDTVETWGGLAQEHVLTRSVRDSAALLDVTCDAKAAGAGVAPVPERPFLDEVGRDPGRLRIAMTGRSLFGRETHADCRAAAEDAARLCAELGHDVVEDFPTFDATATRRAFLVLVATGVAASAQRGALALGREARADDLEPGTWMLVRAGGLVPADDLEAARERCAAAGREVAAFMEERAVDVLLTPTLAHPPLAIGAPGMGPDQWTAARELEEGPSPARLPALLDALTARATEFVGNTALFNVTGQPAMSVPLFWNGEGLPIGVQFAGRYGDEASLFRLASQLEQARPWSGRRPPAS